MVPFPPDSSHIVPSADDQIVMEGEDLRQYEVDGWHVGYEVEIHGVGGVETEFSTNNNGEEPDSSDWESDAPSDVEEGGEGRGMTEVDRRYAGYMSIPAEPGQDVEPSGLQSCSQSENEDDERDNVERNLDVDPMVELALQDPVATSSYNSYVPPSLRSEFERIRKEPLRSVEDEVLPHEPRPIEMDEGKVDAIRQAMAGFSLAPPPEWASASISNQQLQSIVDKLTNK